MIKDHYLLEDMYQVSDELVKLQKCCSKILEKASNADFHFGHTQLDQINESMKVLQGYAKKKSIRDDEDLMKDKLSWRK